MLRAARTGEGEREEDERGGGDPRRQALGMEAGEVFMAALGFPMAGRCDRSRRRRTPRRCEAGSAASRKTYGRVALRRTMKPTMPRPASIMSQRDGSGTGVTAT